MGDVGKQIEIPFKDKYVHFTFYFILVVLWYIYTKKTNGNLKINLILVLAAIGYGILMELFQSLFTTTRTADIFDVMANSLGAISGLLFISNIYNTKGTTH